MLIKLKLSFIRLLLIVISLSAVALVNAPFADIRLWLLGCFGAAAVLIAVDPSGYFARPRAIFVGLMSSSAIGVAASHFIPYLPLAIIAACAISIVVMVWLDAEHPPGGAAAVLAVLGGYDYSFLLSPILTGTIVMVMMRYVSLYVKNRWIRKDAILYSSVTGNASLNIGGLSKNIVKLFELLNNITEASQSAKDVNDATKRTLDEICRFTGWPIGHAYSTKIENNLVTAFSSRLWYLDAAKDPKDIENFVALSEQTVFLSGQGMVGRVLESKAPVTIKDVTGLPGFVRAKAAKDNNVKGCFAFPVIYKGEVKIILEFFSHECAELDEDTLRILEFAGKQLNFVLSNIEYEGRMAQLADNFEKGVKEIVKRNSGSVIALKENAKKLSGTVATTSKSAQEGNDSSRSASSNVGSIAGAVEQMSASISEISRQVAQADDMALLCVDKMKNANNESKNLQEASQKVQQVLKYITDIAEKTSLLALNATIEAARAGEAGRGFAVVANEVKQLAAESNQSAHEIDGIVKNMLLATKDIANTLEDAGRLVMNISETSTAIYAAVEEQSSATNNIAGNMQQASKATANALEKLAGITSSVDVSLQSSREMEKETISMEEHAEIMMRRVDEFLVSIRKSA
jgi:methyl-accepting chemotaxis protein